MKNFFLISLFKKISRLASLAAPIYIYKKILTSPLIKKLPIYITKIYLNCEISKKADDSS